MKQRLYYIHIFLRNPATQIVYKQRIQTEKKHLLSSLYMKYSVQKPSTSYLWKKLSNSNIIGQFRCQLKTQKGFSIAIIASMVPTLWWTLNTVTPKSDKIILSFYTQLQPSCSSSFHHNICVNSPYAQWHYQVITNTCLPNTHCTMTSSGNHEHMFT